MAGKFEGTSVASPIDNNPLASGVNVHRLEEPNAQQIPALNIPNDDQNRQWFLSENTGSRAPISVDPTGIGRIDASMGVEGIANSILNHVGA